uniref:Uncharacterized protein n=1 Tax=Aegilops tauschii subsp. strangulata TaxID=200361 RepID=A0A453HB97_AEGTS
MVLYYHRKTSYRRLTTTQMPGGRLDTTPTSQTILYIEHPLDLVLVLEAPSSPSMYADLKSIFCAQFEQFKHILGVKPAPPGLLAGVPTKAYSISEKEGLPKEFDARSKWSGCSTIGKILGKFN